VLRNGRIVDVHPGTAGAYKAISPELAARLAAAGQAYERATGDKPKYGELSRGEDVQKVYHDRYKSGQGGIAAAPGRSRHQHGEAGDLPDSGFRKWLYAGGAKQFGLHFPVKGDTPHVQADPAFKQRLAAPAPGMGTALNPPTNPGQTGPVDADTRRRAFLATVAKGESPGGPDAYRYMLGGGKFDDFSKHPGQTNTANGLTSTAAGKYQFLKSTWDEQSAKYGYKDFSPETQDLAAWNYAKEMYKLKAGRDLETDLASTDPKVLNSISSALGQTWTSLPGGTQPNSNWKGQDFASVYNENIKANTAVPEASDASVPLDPTPNVGSGASDYPVNQSNPDTNVYDEGGGYSGSGGGGSDTPSQVASTLGKNQFGSGFGEALSGIGQAFGGTGAAGRGGTSPASSTTVPAANLPAPPSPVSMIDPRMVEAQRQRLAQAMARLNSGKLF
jgi:muramidase (phage lysozyme)